jgi:hypothetical protein
MEISIYKQKYLKYKQKYNALKNLIGGTVPDPWKGDQFQDRIYVITGVIKNKIRKFWDNSPFMETVRSQGFELDTLEEVLKKWKDYHTRRFISCITSPVSGVSGNQHIEKRNYSQVIEMLVDTHLLMEREDGYPLSWFDDGMLIIIEILYEKSPTRNRGCMKKN